jgi:hypothetical protein
MPATRDRSAPDTEVGWWATFVEVREIENVTIGFLEFNGQISKTHNLLGWVHVPPGQSRASSELTRHASEFEYGNSGKLPCYIHHSSEPSNELISCAQGKVLCKLKATATGYRIFHRV